MKVKTQGEMALNYETLKYIGAIIIHYLKLLDYRSRKI